MADTAINIQTELDSRATTSTKTSYGAWAKAGLVFGSSIAAFTLANAGAANHRLFQGFRPAMFVMVVLLIIFCTRAGR